VATNGGTAILRLENGIQPYAWGSTTAMAEFLRRSNPGGGPQAELWIGSHSLLPSKVTIAGEPRPLDEILRKAAGAFLPAAVLGRFGPQLPFLLKVLAVAAPLSIQCHPTLDQAREGFARENARGIPLDAPHRSYRDANHKPELIMALTSYTALIGFRSPAAARQLLAALDASDLRPLLAHLEQPGDAGLRPFFAGLMGLPESRRALIAARAAEVAAEAPGKDPAWAWVARLCALYPRDIGVLSPLYLNLVVLRPGEALYLPAGQLHAYLDGLGVEIMANSDNVLRGGLTPKHVDVPELLKLLAFRSEEPAVLRPEPAPDGALIYATPADEFLLAVIDVIPEAPRSVADDHGVEVLLGLEGTVSADGVRLGRGEAALVPAPLGAYRIEGRGRLARARVPSRDGARRR
jgi:mannose-6-phosphate isomerase